MYMACPFELELKSYFRSDLECDKNREKTNQRQSLSPSQFSLRRLYHANAGSVTLDSGQRAACLNGAASSIPPDLGMKVGFDQPREKNVNICLSLHGQWPIIIFFPCLLKLQPDKDSELPALLPVPFPTTAPPLIC